MLPDREGSLVHLHAHQEGVFRELHGGDEVQRRLRLKAHLHASPQEVHVHRHVPRDHQGSSGETTKRQRGSVSAAELETTTNHLSRGSEETNGPQMLNVRFIYSIWSKKINIFFFKGEGTRTKTPIIITIINLFVC